MDMSVDFASLTWNAGLCLNTNASVHIRPNIAVKGKYDEGTHFQRRHGVCKNQKEHRTRDKRLGFPGGRVVNNEIICSRQWQTFRHQRG